MTRDEYIVKLDRELSFLPQEARASAVAFYSEMLDDRMEDGMDESSAVAAMEEPEAIAARLRAEHEQDAPNMNRETDGMRDEALDFSSLASGVLQRVQQVLDGLPQQMDRAVDQAQQAARDAEASARQKAEDALDALEEGRGRVWTASKEGTGASGAYERRVLTCPESQLRAVRLSAANMPIEIIPCQEGQATLVYYTSAQDPYTASVLDGVMTLEREKKENSQDFFTWLVGGIRLMWKTSFPTIELHLPAAALADVSARTGNASIKARGFSALCRVDLHTSNSRIALEDICCKSLEMKTSNGRLALERVESKEEFRGKTSNSRIEGKHLRSGRDMILETANGRVQLEGAAARGDMRLKTANGSITVSRLQARGITLKTSNGSIQGVLPGRQADWQIESGTSNGNNSLPRQQPGEKPLSAFTSNGSIRLAFEEENAGPRR